MFNLKYTISLGLCFLVLSFSGCGSKEAGAGGEKPALVINKLQLTKAELKREYQSSLLSGHKFSETKSTEEPEWVSRVIERELLVQEAQEEGLHRKPEFMLAVERFWKEVLIKILLDKKANEISGKIHVYEPEIDEYYKKLAEENPEKTVEPLIQLREEIERDIRQQKESQALEAWIGELRNKSKIVMDQESFKEIQK